MTDAGAVLVACVACGGAGLVVGLPIGVIVA